MEKESDREEGEIKKKRDKEREGDKEKQRGRRIDRDGERL